VTRLSIWENTNYLDTPKNIEPFKITDQYIRPRLVMNSVMVTVEESEKQREVWSNILSKKSVDIGNIFTLASGQIDDGRGNIFITIRFGFAESKGINVFTVQLILKARSTRL
jgi:hypothetical protein